MDLSFPVYKYQKRRQEILNSIVETFHQFTLFIAFPKCNIITAVSKYMEVTNSLNNSLFLKTTTMKKKNRVCTDMHYIYCYKYDTAGRGKMYCSEGSKAVPARPSATGGLKAM